MSFRRYHGNAWRGWVWQFRRLNVDYRKGKTYHDRILTITWDGKKH